MKVLVVGAGGIGCELLKNLTLLASPSYPLEEVHVVDMDTIDLSNLNRQFLFQSKHIHASKCMIACDALKMRYQHSGKKCSVTFVPHHGNIMDKTLFPLKWFQQFHLFFNALDNVEARSYVNKIVMLMPPNGTSSPNGPSLLHRPVLIESGTEGYEGQVSVIQRGVSECFDCFPRSSVKETYPVCTIRSTPTKYIHCIVWAKDYLLHNLFNSIDATAPSDLLQEESEGSVSGKDKADEEVGKASVAFFQSFSKKLRHQDDPDRKSRNLLFYEFFNEVFRKNIEFLAGLPDLWHERQPPKPFPLSDCAELTRIISAAQSTDDIHELVTMLFESFCLVCDRLSKEDFINFDKDDEPVMKFVYAAASLRASLFAIPRETLFKAKAMAGNIIPAIATTNAIIAGCMVLEAIKYMEKRVESMTAVYYTPLRHFTNVRLTAPNAACLICQPTVKELVVPPSCTLSDTLQLLENDLQMTDRAVSVIESGRTLYDPEFDDNMTRSLTSLSIQQDAILTVIYDDSSLGLFYVIINYCEASSYKVITRYEQNLSNMNAKTVHKELEGMNPDELEPPLKKLKSSASSVEYSEDELFLLQ